ncbi:MAG: CehA/McbA family metallohydrolase [Promethearchaeia archaeon]
MVTKKNILHFSIRLGLFVVFATFLIAGSILVNVEGPEPYLYGDDDWKNVDAITPPGYNETEYNVILDQHSHTLYSDGALTVKQNIEWHRSMGYNTIIFTDHNTMANKEEIEELQKEYDDMVFIQGMEWTTNRIHMNFLSISEWDLDIPSNPTNEQIKEAIKEVHEQNGVVTCNHIPWSINQAGMDNHPTREELLEWGVDYIEIVNDDSAPANHYDEESVEFCESNDIGMITGSDMHRPDDLKSGGIHGWTVLNATEFTEEAIMTKLRAKDTEILYSDSAYSDRGNHKENPWYTVIKPISKFGGIFADIYYEDSLDPVVITIYLSYAFGIFGILEVYRFAKPKVKEKFKSLKNGQKAE